MKSGMIRIFRGIGLGLVLAGAVTSAQAVCSLNGQVVRVQVGATTAAFTFIYLKTSALSAATYVGSVPSTSPFVQAAVTAAATGTRVNMVGNVAACPAVAAGAIGNISPLITFIVNP